MTIINISLSHIATHIDNLEAQVKQSLDIINVAEEAYELAREINDEYSEYNQLFKRSIQLAENTSKLTDDLIRKEINIQNNNKYSSKLNKEKALSEVNKPEQIKT